MSDPAHTPEVTFILMNAERLVTVANSVRIFVWGGWRTKRSTASLTRSRR